MDSTAQLKLLIEKRERARDLDLHDADLADSDLSNLSADGLNLRAAVLRRTKLEEARLGSCCFEKTNCEESDWSGATLRMCVLDGAQAAGARFDDARIEDSSAKGADLTGASLRGSRLSETSFERSVLREAVLDDAEGDGVQFRGADLSRARLTGARLYDADFRGADLREADLSRGRFHDADFRGAILDDVKWTDADVRGALFDKDAGPVQEPTSEPDSRGAQRNEKELEPLVHWLEEILKSAREKTGEEWPSPFANLRDFADSKSADPAEIRELLKTLEKTLTAHGVEGGKMFSSFENILDVLETAPDEPPEDWKPAIAEILTKLKGAEQEPDLIEAFNAFLETISKSPSSHAASQTPEDIGV